MPADNAVVTAKVLDKNGETVKTVTLNKANNWSSTETLPCIKNDETVEYTVEYAYSGPKNVTIDIPAAAGNFVIRVAGNGAKSVRKTVAAVKKSASSAFRKAVKATRSGSASFSDDITHSQIRLPADAEAVGDPVTLSYSEVSANSWHHIWNNLPVSDGEGNTYHYYVKEVSATTDGSVSEINAAYEYEDLSGADGMIHLNGLTPGDYLLTEDGAPAGYNRMTQENSDGGRSGNGDRCTEADESLLESNSTRQKGSEEADAPAAASSFFSKPDPPVSLTAS